MQPDQVPDLGKLRDRADARDAALKEVAEARAMREVEATAAAWDKEMQKAFKGIVSRPQRHALLRRMPEPEAADVD